MEHGVAPHEVNHSESIIEFLDANGNLEDPTQRRDYFSHLEDNDFLEYLLHDLYLNKLSRNRLIYNFFHCFL